MKNEIIELTDSELFQVEGGDWGSGAAAATAVGAYGSLLQGMGAGGAMAATGAAVGFAPVLHAGATIGFVGYLVASAASEGYGAYQAYKLANS